MEGIYVRLIIGVGILAIVSIALIKYLRKNSEMFHIEEYDERQRIAQGESYKKGFQTFVCASAFVAVERMYQWLPIDTSTEVIIAGVLAMLVYAITAIFKDAYLGWNFDNPGRNIISFCVLGAFGILLGLHELRDSGFGAGDVLTLDGTMYIIIGVADLIIMISLGIKMAINRKEEE